MLYEILESSMTLKSAAGHVVEKLNAWGVAAAKMLPNMVVGVIIIIIFWILSSYAARLANRIILKFTGYRHIARLMSRMTTMAIIVIGLVLALDALNLNKAVASMLAGIGIAGVAVGFAAKDLFADYIAGIILHFEHPFHLGDRVQTLLKSATPSGWKSDEVLGYVDSVSWRATIIRGRRGERYTIPNKDILENPIVNFYISGERRIDLYVGIAFTPDLQRAEDLALQAVRALDPPLRNPDRQVEFFYEEIKDTTIIFRIRFWIDGTDQGTFLRARSEAIKAIDKTFKAHEIAFPAQNVSVDFGITGGPSLREQLAGVNLLVSMREERPGEKRGSSETPEEKAKEKQGEKEEDREKMASKEREET